MECNNLFEKTKTNILRDSSKHLYAYKETLFRFRYSNESEGSYSIAEAEREFELLRSSTSTPSDNTKRSKNKKRKKNNKENSKEKSLVSRQGELGQVRVEICESVPDSSSSKRTEPKRDWSAYEFRSALCGKIPIKEISWEECDTDTELQSSLYAHLDKGILKITNIPKIPIEYEPKGDVQYYGFDSEDNSQGRPHFFQFATRNAAYISISFRLLMRFIVQELKLNTKNNIVWGTNIEYDLGNLLKDWDTSKDTCDLKWTKGGLKKFELYYDPEFLDWADKKNDISGAIKVWDTLNHWKMSVKEIGKTLSTHLGYDFNKLPQDFYGLKYSAMDAILSRSYACIQKNYYDNKGIELKFTPGATALNYYTKGHDKNGDLFCKHKIFDTHTDEELQWIISGLRGGRTEVFSLKEFTGKIGYFDINSAYPYSMKFGVFPHPSAHFWEKGHNKISKLIKNGYEGMIECEVDTENCNDFVKVIPYLGTVEPKTGRYIFPLGKWKSKYTVFEILKAEAIGYKFKFLEGILYERSLYQPFAGFVDFCYAIRDEGTLKGDKILRDIGKSLGNNLYGKFGQRLKMTELENPEDYKETDIEDCIRIGDGVLIEKDNGFAPHSNGIWSAYITAICRDLLYGHMLNAWIAGNEVIYCDTDSIFIHGGKPPESHQTKLGALKHEMDLSLFKAMLPKTYIYQPMGGSICYKAKGVPYLQQETFLTTGEVEYKKPLKIREALRRKNLPGAMKQGMGSVNAWITVKKQLKGKYTKRIVNKDGSTKPIYLDL